MQASEHSTNNQHNDGRRTRRSKNDLSGRNKQCNHCDKSYLSEIALNSHIKAKHPNLIENVTRPRGRPKKTDEVPIKTQGVDFSKFFESGIQMKDESSEPFDLIYACKENFDNIYNKYKELIFLSLPASEEYKFLANDKEEFQSKSCNDAFWSYLVFCADKTNRDYFDFIFKFIVLFRESIINSKKQEEFVEKEGSAECIPDMCNDFVGEFMENNDFFGLDCNELIKIIQHCCNWLWEKSFTTSRLSLLSN